MASLSPPIALVTAGSAGLGAAVATLLARNGMRVAINYHGNEERAADFVSQLQTKETTLPPQEGRVDYHAIKADLASRADVQRLVEETASVFATKQIDVVFSNGGWTRMRNLMDLDDNLDDEDWDRCFTMNVKSHLWLMHAARPYLEAAYNDEAGAASFITTASLAGVKVSGSSLAYAVTKAAQLHLAKGLAQIAAPKIRVNSVSPGLLLTVRAGWPPFFSSLSFSVSRGGRGRERARGRTDLLIFTGMGITLPSGEDPGDARGFETEKDSYNRGRCSIDLRAREKELKK